MPEKAFQIMRTKMQLVGVAMLFGISGHFSFGQEQRLPEEGRTQSYLSHLPRQSLDQRREEAEQGYPSYKIMLAWSYYDARPGLGIVVDRVEAAKWFMAAAQQGDSTAQFNTAVLYFRGDGVPQDYRQAYIWFDLAARSKPGFVACRDAVGKSLTRDAIQAAQQFARNWKRQVERGPEAPSTQGPYLIIEELCAFPPEIKDFQQHRYPPW